MGICNLHKGITSNTYIAVTSVWQIPVEHCVEFIVGVSIRSRAVPADSVIIMMINATFTTDFSVIRRAQSAHEGFRGARSFIFTYGSVHRFGSCMFFNMQIWRLWQRESYFTHIEKLANSVVDKTRCHRGLTPILLIENDSTFYKVFNHCKRLLSAGDLKCYARISKLKNTATSFKNVWTMVPRHDSIKINISKRLHIAFSKNPLVRNRTIILASYSYLLMNTQNYICNRALRMFGFKITIWWYNNRLNVVR